MDTDLFVLYTLVFENYISFQDLTQRVCVMRENNSSICIKTPTQSLVHSHLPTLLPGFLSAEADSTEGSVYRLTPLTFEYWLNFLSCCEPSPYMDALLTDTSCMMIQMEENLPLSTLAKLLFKLPVLHSPHIQYSTLENILFSIKTLLRLSQDRQEQFTREQISCALSGLQNFRSSVEVDSILSEFIPHIAFYTQQQNWLSEEELTVIFNALRNKQLNTTTSALLENLIPHIKHYVDANQGFKESNCKEIIITIEKWHNERLGIEVPVLDELLRILLSL